MKSNSITKFECFLHKSIPLTQDMGLHISELNTNSILVKAPLQNNINDKGSVFGGSSSALMIISAWSLIKLKCQQYGINADIVIHKNVTTWNKALYSELIIKAKLSQSYSFGKIKNKIGNNKHQRIACEIKLMDNDNLIYSTMMAHYVIIPKKP